MQAIITYFSYNLLLYLVYLTFLQLLQAVEALIRLVRPGAIKPDVIVLFQSQNGEVSTRLIQQILGPLFF